MFEPIALVVAMSAIAADSSTTARALFDRAFAIARLRTESVQIEPLPEPVRELRCVAVEKKSKGTTPKVRCKREDGRKLKVKYGIGNQEIVSEVLSTWLMRRAGFFTDEITLVRTLRCEGCPEAEYAWVSVEKRLRGKRAKLRGLDVDDLQKLPSATRAEKDALFLMMAFLQHWDDIPANQAIVCLDGKACTRAGAYLRDLGASFGSWRAVFDANGDRRKSARMNLDTWAREPVWADLDHCIVQRPRSTKRSPAKYTIGEEGRRIVADALGSIKPADVVRLFERSAVLEHRLGKPADWARVFLGKVEKIRARRCGNS